MATYPQLLDWNSVGHDHHRGLGRDLASATISATAAEHGRNKTPESEPRGRPRSAEIEDVVRRGASNISAAP